MKYITGALIVVTAVLGCSYVEASPCSDLWKSNPQARSASFIEVSKTQPEVTESVKRESIALCEKTILVTKDGAEIEDVVAMINRSSRHLPEAGRVSMMFMAVGGWQIGKIGE